MTLFAAARRRISALLNHTPEINPFAYAREGMARERRKDEAITSLVSIVRNFRASEAVIEQDNLSDEEEFLAAQRMGGAGPWMQPGTREQQIDGIKAHESMLRESIGADNAQGAYGDIELALQNVAWRRETNMSWLEFSRWGIQQIILISRLYYIKNPIILRGINISALYVFGRGVQVSSPDPHANAVIQDFFESNKNVLGQNALMELERRKYYDGNLFFCFFTDAQTGAVMVRTIDATEVNEIVTDPEDADTKWYFLRVWTQSEFNIVTGGRNIVAKSAYYPALGYDPAVKPKTIGKYPVMWDNPVLHRKVGGVAKWLWGCPLVYAALDWAKASREWLEACMTVRQALAQFAMIFKTKGGQQAMEGAKEQLSTTIGPSSSLLDQNPPAGYGSIFTSGMGSSLEAFKTQGAAGNPDDVRRYLLMCAMVFGCPESFWADMNTSNLATATSLDRPTELNFVAKQEEWSEDLVTIVSFVLSKSGRATGGRLREGIVGAAGALDKFTVREVRTVRDTRGRRIYEKADQTVEPGVFKIMAEFPAIIEADTPALIAAVVDAMTLGSRRGEINGIDEKAGIRMLYKFLNVPDYEELLDLQFPETGADAYDPKRTSLDDPEAGNPEGAADPGAKTGGAGGGGALKESLARLREALKAFADMPEIRP